MATASNKKNAIVKRKPRAEAGPQETTDDILFRQEQTKKRSLRARIRVEMDEETELFSIFRCAYEV